MHGATRVGNEREGHRPGTSAEQSDRVNGEAAEENRRPVRVKRWRCDGSGLMMENGSASFLQKLLIKPGYLSVACPKAVVSVVEWEAKRSRGRGVLHGRRRKKEEKGKLRSIGTLTRNPRLGKMQAN